MPTSKTEQFMRSGPTPTVGTGAGQASRWPHQIHTFPDLAVRRLHVKNKCSRMEGTHVAAGTEYPHLPLSVLSLVVVVFCVCVRACVRACVCVCDPFGTPYLTVPSDE